MILTCPNRRGLRPLDTKETEQRPQMQSLPSPKPAARSVSVRGRGVGPRVMSQPVVAHNFNVHFSIYLVEEA